MGTCLDLISLSSVDVFVLGVGDDDGVDGVDDVIGEAGVENDECDKDCSHLIWPTH